MIRAPVFLPRGSILRGTPAPPRAAAGRGRHANGCRAGATRRWAAAAAALLLASAGLAFDAVAVAVPAAAGGVWPPPRDGTLLRAAARRLGRAGSNAANGDAAASTAAAGPPPSASATDDGLRSEELPPFHPTWAEATAADIQDIGDLDGGAPAERVIGGTLAQWQMPTGFHAKFFLNDRFACAGTLITRRHLLTAAHCNINANSTVRLGGLMLDEGFQVPIGRVFTHPAYQPATSRSDVAVVELGREVTWAQMQEHALQVVRLNPWPALPHSGSSRTLTGWGYRIQSPGGTASDQLIKAQLTIIDVKECNARYERLALLSIASSQELCAGLNGRRSCNGDSGGPLWAVDNSRGGRGFVQYGLVSSAIGSKRLPCDSAWPTVFMRTSYYMDWINDTIGKKYTLL